MGQRGVTLGGNHWGRYEKGDGWCDIAASVGLRVSSDGLRGFLALSGRGIKRHSLRKCVDGGLSYVLRLLCWIISRGLV